MFCTLHLDYLINSLLEAIASTTPIKFFDAFVLLRRKNYGRRRPRTVIVETHINLFERFQQKLQANGLALTIHNVPTLVGSLRYRAVESFAHALGKLLSHCIEMTVDVFVGEFLKWLPLYFGSGRMFPNVGFLGLFPWTHYIGRRPFKHEMRRYLSEHGSLAGHQ